MKHKNNENIRKKNQAFYCNVYYIKIILYYYYFYSIRWYIFVLSLCTSYRKSVYMAKMEFLQNICIRKKIIISIEFLYADGTCSGDSHVCWTNHYLSFECRKWMPSTACVYDIVAETALERCMLGQRWPSSQLHAWNVLQRILVAVAVNWRKDHDEFWVNYIFVESAFRLNHAELSSFFSR